MELTFKSAGVSARTTDLTGPTGIEPQGVPAGVVGTSLKGPAFVPTTVATTQDFSVKFGSPTNDAYNGPLAVSEWLANQQAATFIRVLGIGEGKRREKTGNHQGRVAGAGFVVGNEIPQERLGGNFGPNQYANLGGSLGRTYVLGAVMSQSVGSSILTDAGQGSAAVPLVRGVLMTPSGVIASLSTSWGTADNNPPSSYVAPSAPVAAYGSLTGSVNLRDGRQEFVVLLNGHKGSDPRYPNILTASFDVTQPNYFANVFNTDPLKIEEAGHLVYADYPIHPSMAIVTGSGYLYGNGEAATAHGYEPVAFLQVTYNRNQENTGSYEYPNYENFEDRFAYAQSPWVVSQKFSGATENLFKIWSKDAGQYPNNRIKFSIENITPGTDARPYGTFDLVVREMNDTDKTRSVLEAFRGLSLNPESDRYIAKVIGDTNTFYNFDAAEGKQNLVTVGDYPSRSNFIRVEMATLVEDGEIDSSALPFGFDGPPYLVTNRGVYSSTDPAYANNFYQLSESVMLPVPYRDNLVVGAGSSASVDKGLYWGVQFTRKTSPTEPNGSTIEETAIVSFAHYFPDFRTASQSFLVRTEQRTTGSETPINSDDYNNNAFNLENIRIRRNESTDAADTLNLTDWDYIRNGVIVTSGAYRSLQASDLVDPTVRQVAKFSCYFQGGFDGTNMFNYDMANLTNQAIQQEMTNGARGITNGPTVKAYDRTLDLMADATEVDIQLLTIPGIRQSIITDKALLVTENRFDAMYIMDVENYDTTNLLITGSNQITSVRYTGNQLVSRGLNSSFGAAYFPDVNLEDTRTGTIRTVAPSVAVLGAFGLNDKVGYSWFAPAGFTRGAMKRVRNATVALDRNNLDSLQEARINPLVAFANSNGTLVWGQKTLLATDSALERVNVRRLLIDVRRKVRKVANRVVFEQGRTETLQRFEQLVRPILKDVQSKKGVERFLVKIDTETTTQADINNRTIRGKIYLVPTKSLEFLSIDFELTNSGNFGTEG